jgi:hypothetical protein
MADEEDGEALVMEKEVHIVVQVTVRKGEPVPYMPRVKTASTTADDEEGEEEGEEGEGDGEEGAEGGAETEPKPTLEELGVKFVLSTFNGQSQERYAPSHAEP